jgi:flagellar basal body-associated protein FliL
VIRLIALIVVACISTVGGVYGAVSWKSGTKAARVNDNQPKLQLMKTRMVSVPVLTDGQVLGYVVMRLQFTADSDLVKASSVQPDAFVADEAFRLIYETTPNEIKTGRKQAIKELTANIAAGANKRMGRDVVKDIMIDSWTYLSKQDMMRNNEHAR